MRSDHAYIIRCLLTARDVPDYADILSGAMKRIADYLAILPPEDRHAAWEAYSCSFPDPEAIVAALANADPLGLMPQIAQQRFATVGDLRGNMTGTAWAWEGWLPLASIVGLAAFEGCGKTRAASDLCRRVYLGLPWPDGQPPTFPAGTRSVWVCSDAHHHELAETMAAFGLPDDAVYFPTTPADPYGGTDLDAPETMEAIEAVVAEVKPAFVFIDTLTSATGRNLCDQQAMMPLTTPLAEMCQRHGVTVVLILHLSREGQALGRRIKGITRTLIHLECPDPDMPGRLRMWVEKSFAVKPPPLGLTMGAGAATSTTSTRRSRRPRPRWAGRRRRARRRWPSSPRSCPKETRRRSR